MCWVPGHVKVQMKKRVYQTLKSVIEKQVTEKHSTNRFEGANKGSNNEHI